MSWTRSRTLAMVCFLATAFFLDDSTLVAGPIEPWQGASAKSVAIGQQTSVQGLHANAYAEGETRLYYGTPYTQDPRGYSVVAAGTAQAEVLGTADALLRVDSIYRVGNPGTSPRFDQPDVPTATSAQASWMGDRIHLSPGSSGTLPDSIRVGVGLTLTAPDDWKQANLNYGMDVGGVYNLKLGDNVIDVNRGVLIDEMLWKNDGPYHDAFVGMGFDSVTKTSIGNDQSRYHVKAFVDLAVDAEGWSDPFDLSLKTTLDGLPRSNTQLLMNLGSSTLSIDDITLSDGTSVNDAGYGVAFDSGLAWPVPEPTSVACWSVVAVAVAASRRLRKRTRFADAVV